jgi:NADH-quinone oxidoreductase subunit C
MLLARITEELNSLFEDIQVSPAVAEPVAEAETTPAGEQGGEEAVSGQESPKAEESAPEAAPQGPLATDYKTKGYHLNVALPPDKIVAAIEILNREKFFLEAITGVDWIAEQQLEVVYDFNHYAELCRVVIRTRLDRNNPEVPTISNIYQGANWHERETHDFFGIKFTGHPNLEPLLLPEDADFHPLLKDFKA